MVMSGEIFSYLLIKNYPVALPIAVTKLAAYSISGVNNLAVHIEPTI